MRYPKLRELKEAVKALIKGPYTNRFPFRKHVPFDRFRGRPYFDEKNCTGCTACVQVCPTGALEFKDQTYDGKVVRVLTVHWDVCIFCGQCQANCLTGKGIMLSREFDFATTGKRQELKQEIEKIMVTCECCGEAVAPYDQYVWVAERLGPLVFSNASLLLFYLRSLNLAAKTTITQKEKKEFLRADRVKVLCPACRREAVANS